MKRYAALEDISDGKLYTANDLVKANCHGCEGCSRCCHGMGNTVVLDPYDCYRMTVQRGKSFPELLQEGTELGMVDGLIQPSLTMKGKNEACSYLDENGRCSIHAYRPGICRLFPLGRLYDETGLHYFLQKGECSYQSRSKIKVKQWIDTENLQQNEAFEVTWHTLLSDCRKKIAEEEKKDESEARETICKGLLQLFYLTPYQESNFYEQFERRAAVFRETFLAEG